MADDAGVPGSADGIADLFNIPAPLEDLPNQPTSPAPNIPFSGSPSTPPEPGPASGTPPQPPVSEEPLEPKNDPRRFEYHQSRADKLQRQLEELQPYVPVARYIQQNPKILDMVEQDIKGKRAGAQPPAVEVPKPPARPKKPDGYTVEETGTPGSKSWQYHQDLLEYSAAAADYQVARDQYLQQQAELRAQEEARAQMAQKQLSQISAEAQRTYGLTAEEAQEFVQFYTDPRYEMPQLVQLFRLNKQQAARARGASPSSPMGPAPAGIMPGMSGRLPTPGAPDPSLAFNADFFDEYRRVRGLPPLKR